MQSKQSADYTHSQDYTEAKDTQTTFLTCHVQVLLWLLTNTSTTSHRYIDLQKSTFRIDTKVIFIIDKDIRLITIEWNKKVLVNNETDYTAEKQILYTIQCYFIFLQNIRQWEIHNEITIGNK